MTELIVCVFPVLALWAAFLIGRIVGLRDRDKAEADYNNRRWRQSDGE